MGCWGQHLGPAHHTQMSMHTFVCACLDKFPQQYMNPPCPFTHPTAFNTFGEVWACWLQDIILVGLIYHYTRTPLWQALGSAALFAGSCFWLLGSCPPGLLASLQASTIVVMAIGSRVPQIVLNMKRGDAGVLSVTTCLLNVAGNAARAFTTVVLTGDMLLLSGTLVQGALNGILLYQSVRTEQAKRGPGTAAVPAPA